METFEKQWYVLHTYSGYENKVKANIESRAQSMKMADFIFRVVVPEEKETEVKNGKEKEIVHKTFPGYVLVEMIMTDASWYVRSEERRVGKENRVRWSTVNDNKNRR